MKILICGGAGYIGSHMAKYLFERGHQITILDNLSTGNRWAAKWGDFFEADLTDQKVLHQFFRSKSFDAVMHFSAFSLVGESVDHPAKYYRNNMIGTLNLLEAMRDANIKRFIFSSTAATFGMPETDKMNEAHPQRPINPYGRSKLMIEEVLKDYAFAYGLHSVSLRYFNAAGADPEGETGEAHDPETHLIPNILKSLNGDHCFKIFGNDYPTFDGTCVRDYIHVLDLCQAHLQALNYLDNHSGAFGFNLGNGQGFSVLQVMNAVEKVTGLPVNYEIVERRPGDPPTLVADSQLARQELGWVPEYTDLEMIVKTAWDWEKNTPYLKRTN